ncbi:MAG: hypothetical protein K8S54_14420 [Spirochaetia bacterium]|nr:hypothetical protein [Spirochaetia bacterium]
MLRRLLLTVVCILFLNPAVAQENILPVPRPPDFAELLLNSDIVVRGRLIHSQEFKIGSLSMAQPRFICMEIFKASAYFPLLLGERFTVTHRIRADELGPGFHRPADPGEYIVFLNVRNVEAGGKITGYIAVFPDPQSYAIWEVTDDLITRARAFRSQSQP